jgi:hypothetical protein
MNGLTSEMVSAYWMVVGVVGARAREEEEEEDAAREAALALIMAARRSK